MVWCQYMYSLSSLLLVDCYLKLPPVLEVGGDFGLCGVFLERVTDNGFHRNQTGLSGT